MTLRTAASVAVLTIALGLPPHAMAQTQSAPPSPSTERTAPPKMPVTGQILVQDASTVLGKDLINQPVYAPDKTKIGTIADLILTNDGTKVEGFIIGVGGFLGIGEKNVALKIDRLKITPESNGVVHLAMDVKKEELANAPSFRSKGDLDAERRAEQSRNETPAKPTMPKTN